ncbi:MAG: lipopolysaccharide kinase InaA family protein [Planctomycetota bacterium]
MKSPIIRRLEERSTPPLAAWRLAPGVRSALPGDLSSAQAIKAGPHRSVFASGDRIIKISPSARALRQEWQRLESAARCGLPVPKALGIATHQGIAWLVLEREPGTTLDALGEDPARRRALAPVLGESLRTMHAAGWIHRDLHPGNVLVRPGGELMWLDGGALRRRRLPRSHLPRLAAALPPSWSRTDLLRAAKAYFGSSSRSEVRRLGDKVQRERIRIWRKRTRRCLRINRTFEQIAAGELRGFARRERPFEIAGWIQELESHGPSPTLRVLKDGRTTSVFAAQAPPVVLKRYHRDGGPLRRSVLSRAPTRGRLAWQRLEALAVRHLSVPTGWAFLEQPRGRRRSWLALKRLDGVGLDRAWSSADRDGRQMLIEVTARFIATLHERGASCRDLKAANLLVRDDRGHPHVSLIDMDGVRELRRPPGPRRRWKDLVRLNASFDPGIASLADRLRFWKAYHRITQRPPRRRDLRRILSATERKRATWASTHRSGSPAPAPPFRPEERTV